MARKTSAPRAPAPRIDADFRARHLNEPITRDMKRFDIFLIDTGWNARVSTVVRTHLPLLYCYQRQDSLYLLTPEQSVEVFKREPRLIGHDPIIQVYDRLAPSENKSGIYRGFRLHLGRFKSAEQALSRLQEFVRFINLHRTALCLDCEVRRELHREGLAGMVKILREAKTELL
jgi:hypothetical protein